MNIKKALACGLTIGILGYALIHGLNSNAQESAKIKTIIYFENQHLVIMMDENATIADLKNKLQQSTGVNRGDIRLSLGNKEIEDQKSLKDLPNVSSSIIKMENTSSK